MRWVWRNLKGKRVHFVIAMVLSALSVSAVIVAPRLMQIIVNEVLGKGRHDLIIPIAAALVGTQLVRGILRFVMGMLLEVASQHALCNVRQTIFHNMLTQESRFFDHHRTGDLLTRLTGDLDMVRHSVAWVSFVTVDSVVMFVVATVFLLSISLTLTICMLVITPLIAILSYVYIKKIYPMYSELRLRLSNLNTMAQENIAGNRVIKAFAREQHETEKFDEKNAAFMKANLAAAKKWQQFFPVLDMICQSLSIIMLLVGGLFVIYGRLDLGSLFAFSGLTWALAGPMRTLGTLLNDMQRFFASADKIIEVYYARPTIADRHDALPLPAPVRGEIVFDDVTFSYDGHSPVLDHLSFTIEAGETLAIMGPTGSGKTTLLSLIGRFYDVSEGQIRLDGVDVHLCRLSDLRSKIGMASQDVFLFSDTVEGNVAYGDPDMPVEDVYTSAKAAAADDFVRKMEDGYDTIIGERGVGLSGGQRQRIALARALAVRPAILMLDDTTSAVDMETEHYIQEQLRALPFSCTKLIVAQRISSVKHADRILILENGSVTIGTHRELSAQPGYYREICQLQGEPDLPELATTEGGIG